MSSTTSGPTNSTANGIPPSPQDVRAYLAGKHICPFCGTLNESPEGPCVRCRMEDTPATRKATKVRIGPWYVLHSRNPSAPGMKFDTLISLVRKGQVSPRSIVRGPTTQQLWKFAARIKGLSREFGLCYNCGEAIEHDSNFCPHCNRLQEPPLNPDSLLEIDETSVAAALAERPVDRPVRRPPPVVQPVAEAETREEQLPPAPTTVQAARPMTPPSEPPTPPRGLLEEEIVVTPEPAPTTVPPPPPAQQFPPPRTPELKHEGKILSPEDLAAAFKIDLKPGSGYTPGVPAQKKRHGFRNTVLIVLLFAALGATVVFALRPDLRNAAVAWASEQFDAGKRFVMAKPALPPPPPQSVAVRPTPTPAPSPDLPEATISSHVESPVAIAPTIPAVTPAPTPTQTPTPTPTPRIETPEAAAPPTPTTAPAPTPQIVEAAAPYPTTAPTPVVVKVDPPAPAPTPKPATVDLPKAIAQARTLWYEAFDAEQRRDFAAAARLYAQIKKLPEGAWPAGLQIRLDRAQKAADQGGD